MCFFLDTGCLVEAKLAGVSNMVPIASVGPYIAQPALMSFNLFHACSIFPQILNYLKNRFIMQLPSLIYLKRAWAIVKP